MTNSDKFRWLVAMSGWASFALSLWKHYKDRTILQFVISTTYVDVQEEYADMAADGRPMARAIEIKVTNNGPRPITIEKCRCVYFQRSEKNDFRRNKSEAWIHEKISQGEACTGHPKLQFKNLVHVLEASVTDSSDREWKVPARALRQFHRRGTDLLRCPLLTQPGWWFRLTHRTTAAPKAAPRGSHLS